MAVSKTIDCYNCIVNTLFTFIASSICIIERKVISSTPVQTEYYLTEKGRRLNKIIFEMFDFALDEVMKNESNSKLKEESKENLRVCLNP